MSPVTGLPDYVAWVRTWRWVPDRRAFVSTEPVHKTYNPLMRRSGAHEEPVHLALANCDLTDPKSIARFLNHYGVLDSRYVNSRVARYRIERFRSTATEVKATVRLWAAYQRGDAEELRAAIRNHPLGAERSSDRKEGDIEFDWMPSLSWREFVGWLDRAPVEGLKARAERFLQSAINYYLQVVQHRFTIDQGTPRLIWLGSELLCACYYLLMQDILDTRELDYCPRCRVFYCKNRKNGVHTPKCAASLRQRRHRAKERRETHSGGAVYSGQMARDTDNTSGQRAAAHRSSQLLAQKKRRNQANGRRSAAHAPA